MFASLAERARFLRQIGFTSSVVLSSPITNEVDKDGNFSIKLNSGVTLKATKRELELLIQNIQKVINNG